MSDCGCRIWGMRIATGAVMLWACVSLAMAQGRGGGQAGNNWADNLPPGNGKELTAERCGSCHSLERTVQLRKSKNGWEDIVFDMVGRGAPIFVDEANQIVDYLTAVLGPEAPPFIDVNRASKEDMVKVPGLTAELADKLVAYRQGRGPLTSRDQIREVLGLDEKTYERIRYYLAAGPPASGATPAQ
jgi:DNA uptake protein ComE-like DNA-binding protein